MGSGDLFFHTPAPLFIRRETSVAGSTRLNEENNFAGSTYPHQRATASEALFLRMTTRFKFSASLKMRLPWRTRAEPRAHSPYSKTHQRGVLRGNPSGIWGVLEVSDLRFPSAHIQMVMDVHLGSYRNPSFFFLDRHSHVYTAVTSGCMGRTELTVAGTDEARTTSLL